MLKSEFQKFHNFVFDLDGTVWYWDELVPGVKEAMEALRTAGKEIYFLTNNSMLSPQGFVERLGMLGIKTDVSRIICPADFIATYLREKGAKRIFTISLDAMDDYLKEKGFLISGEPDYVVLTFSRDREPLESRAVEFISKGVPAITNATGKKWVLRDRVLIGTGVIVEKIEKLSGRKIELVGKPSDFSVNYVKKNYDFKPEETIYIGDSLNSDMKFARKSGWSFAFVLTGEYARRDLEKWEKPDFVLENPGDMLK